ncbi:hypothetical protein, partial [Streptomyces sp. SID5770]|uniref:hypothetical protein n=1 Tax=Streptomyces sp. SID5770 TaxID=2690308 RepID=UPI001F478348
NVNKIEESGGRAMSDRILLRLNNLPDSEAYLARLASTLGDGIDLFTLQEMANIPIGEFASSLRHLQDIDLIRLTYD